MRVTIAIVVGVVLVLLWWVIRHRAKRFAAAGLGEASFSPSSRSYSQRRVFSLFVGLIVLVFLFYAEENWRGKRAWERCKRDLEAKGEVLDWSAYIPAQIPDDQNIMKAPNMAKWFYKNSPEALSTNSLSSRFSYRQFYDPAKTNNPESPVLIARIVVVPTVVEAKNAGEISIQLTTPEGQGRLKKLLQDAVGPSANGSQGFITFVQRPANQIKPSQVSLQTDQRLSISDLSRIIPASLVSSNVGHLRVEADVEPGSFRVVLATKPVIPAADYLTTSDAAMLELNLIREALKRPQIRLEGDFQRPFDFQLPFEMPMLNFVAIRSVAQVAAQRAQCCLLLGRPEQAFHELSLVYELRRLLAAKPKVLVSAMIDVAICGLYAGTIAEGFRLQAWREPELVALQKQLQAIDLPPIVVDSLRSERAAICQTFLVISAEDIAEWDNLGDHKTSSWKLFKKLTNPRYLLLQFAPRGWLYQNLAVCARLEQTGIEVFDPETQLINPRKSDESVREHESVRHRWNVFRMLAGYAVPNFSKALRATAQNQTLVNQAFVACGLERYRLARGEYPETLDALVPQFAERLPRDIIGGQALRYHRTADGKFLLYSVGWNEKDDGGEPGTAPDLTKGDWVWDSHGI